jgi:hypothetical protein
MKRIRLLVAFLLAVMVLAAVSAPTASAQALSDVWLKLKVKTKGYSHDWKTGAYSTSNLSVTAYVNFIGPGPGYNAYLWNQVNGEWVNLGIAPAYATAYGENFINPFTLRFWMSATDYVEVTHTPFITYSGSKVTYKAIGWVDGGFVEGGSRGYFGSATISGSRVDPSKLPFTP